MDNKQTETIFTSAARGGHSLHKYLAALALSSIFAVAAATAQTSTVEGVVRGPDGKAIKSADVRLEPKVKGVAAQAVKTDSSGRYRFSNVPVGKYRVAVLSGSQISGFIDNVNTSANQASKIDFDLKGGAAGKPKKAKHLVWVPSETGSNLGGRWVEEDDTSGTERVEKKSAAAVRSSQSATTTTTGGH